MSGKQRADNLLLLELSASPQLKIKFHHDCIWIYSHRCKQFPSRRARKSLIRARSLTIRIMQYPYTVLFLKHCPCKVVIPESQWGKPICLGWAAAGSCAGWIFLWILGHPNPWGNSGPNIWSKLRKPYRLWRLYQTGVDGANSSQYRYYIAYHAESSTGRFPGCHNISHVYSVK